MPRALVTGGAGFLGSHLCRLLLARGFNVVAMDNLITGARRNIAELETDPRFEFVSHDVSKHITVEGPLDRIYHLASPASPIDYLEFPIQTLKVGSLGTHNVLGLALAKKARLMLASTSEVYGDPAVHPQPESYWGHVNPVGPRGVYDEAKRFAEAMTMAYHRFHGVDTRIARIFNSILGDEQLLYDDGTELRRETADQLARRLGMGEGDRLLEEFSVPSIGLDGRAASRPASAFVAHPTAAKCVEIRTRYGRSVRVTEDHSVFIEGPDGLPLAVRASAVKPGTRIAVMGRVSVPERDRQEVDVVTMLRDAGHSAHDILIGSPGIGDVVWERRAELATFYRQEARYAGTAATPGANVMWSEIRHRSACDEATFEMLERLSLGVPHGARVNVRGGRSSIPARITLSDSLLWFFGLMIAEGCWNKTSNDWFVTLSSDSVYLDRAMSILSDELGLHVTPQIAQATRAPSIRISSRMLYEVVRGLGFATEEKNIPGWVLGLPLARLKHFVEGFREGDGVHSGKKLAEGKRHEFSTTSDALKNDLIVLFARFGIVPSVGKYVGNIWRLTLANVAPWSPLEWDRGVVQTLNARRSGDVVWASVDEIVPIEATPLVYDFSVPGTENFYAGTGVMCHNTYGTRMRPHDGRVVSNFIIQALNNQPLTIYGDGSQTRSFCYVSDLVEGFWRLVEENTDPNPVNLGNPDEYTVLDCARLVRDITHSASEIVFKPLPEDDPKVRRPDITRARALLKWTPRVPVREGIATTVEYFRSLPPEELRARHLGGK